MKFVGPAAGGETLFTNVLTATWFQVVITAAFFPDADGTAATGVAAPRDSVNSSAMAMPRDEKWWAALGLGRMVIWALPSEMRAGSSDLPASALYEGSGGPDRSIFERVRALAFDRERERLQHRCLRARDRRDRRRGRSRRECRPPRANGVLPRWGRPTGR